MCRFTSQNGKHKAFTLIELLVVIGLIALLAAGIGISMRDGTPTSTLRAGQSSLAGLLASARGQAALSQNDTMIIVDVADASQEACLRSLQVVVRAGPGLDQWRPVGTPIMLPQGIYVVPPPASVGTVPTSGTAALASGWDSRRRSLGFELAATNSLTERNYHATDYPYQPTGAFTNKSFIKFRTFSPLGTTSGEGTILVTAGKRIDASTISFDNQEVVRGVFVSRYGVATLINEAATFENVTIP